jgi:mRNA-degrading endonuclease YafQ of YafQ-DinJ toxin-antitoxin module
MLNRMIFHDIVINHNFLEDWTGCPSIVKESVDRKIHQLALEHKFRPSARLHRVRGEEGLWIMYANQSQGHWRMIVKVENEILHLVRLLCHSDMEHEYPI